MPMVVWRPRGRLQITYNAYLVPSYYTLVLPVHTTYPSLLVEGLLLLLLGVHYRYAEMQKALLVGIQHNEDSESMGLTRSHEDVQALKNLLISNLKQIAQIRITH